MGSGQSRVSDSDILSLFTELDEPILTTSEVADKLPIGQRATYNRLEQLADEGSLKKKKVGARGAVWWPANLTFQRQARIPTLGSEINIQQLDLDPDENQYVEKREAILESFRHLRSEGTASRSSFITEVYPENKAGYQNQRAWWEKLIRPNLAKLSSVKKAPRGGKWEYTNE